MNEGSKKMKSEKKNTPTAKRLIFDLLQILIIAVLMGMAVQFFCKPTVISGDSMNPTLENEDFYLLNRLEVWTKTIDSRDIVVFKTETDRLFIKRVIGLPGDKVAVKKGKVLVNDKVIAEDYINDVYTDGELEVVVPENAYFVLGDNRLPGRSLDSRYDEVGFVKHGDIIGTTMLRVRPL